MTAPKTPGRPRSEAARTALLAAALALLREQGWGGVTMDAIAARAGVGKNTLYRRWRSPAAVLLDAFAGATAERIVLPDTGSVLGDVTALLQTAFRRLRETDDGQVVRTLMAAAQSDEELRRDMRERFIVRRRHALATLIERGRGRGEVAADLDLELSLDLIYGAMWYRLLSGHAPLDDEFAAALARRVLCP